MKYMGSKARIAKHILPIMLGEAEKQGVAKWIEPFVGGANMIDKVPDTFERIGYDYNEYLIAMFNALQNNWNPPTYTKDDYTYIRNNKGENKYVTGWVGINCSYGGKWFGGFAGKVQTKGGVRDYQDEAKRNTLKQMKDLIGVKFENSSVFDLDFDNSLIYCDPPYKDTTKYANGGFDHEMFYGWCRNQKEKGNIVFVSEYEMPEDFKEVWSQEVKSSLSANGVSGGNKVSVEKLFIL